MLRPAGEGPDLSSNDVSDARLLRPWSALSPSEQLALRERYGRYLETLPPTCDLGTKMERFRDWLALEGVELDRLG